MVWVAVVGARILFLLPTSSSASLGRSGRYRRLLPCIIHRNYINRLGAWNVRGINDITKREEVVDIFKKGKFELVAFTETKSKGKGVNVSLPVFRRWKGVALLLNDVWHSAMVKSGCVSSRIL